MTKPDRQSRLAAALRENLKRRKRQTRVREAHEEQGKTPPQRVSACDGANELPLGPRDSNEHEGAKEHMILKETD